MRLYRAKIPVIAHEVIESLTADEDIEVAHENKEEAEKDLVAIMEEYRRRDFELRERIRDTMARRQIPYTQYGKVRKRVSEEMEHPTGDDVERFLARQFTESMMISRFVDEVYSEDAVIYKKLIDALKSHDVDETEIREEARTKVKNVREGTVDYEIALQQAMKDVRKRRGLT